jgi:hypothetical protein
LKLFKEWEPRVGAGNFKALESIERTAIARNVIKNIIFIL